MFGSLVLLVPLTYTFVQTSPKGTPPPPHHHHFLHFFLYIYRIIWPDDRILKLLEQLDKGPPEALTWPPNSPDPSTIKHEWDVTEQSTEHRSLKGSQGAPEDPSSKGPARVLTWGKVIIMNKAFSLT